MMKYGRPVQDIYEYAGVYVPVLKEVDAIVNRLVRRDVSLTGLERLAGYLKANGENQLFDMTDVQLADAICTRILFERGEAAVNIDDICLVWWLDMIARHLHTFKTQSVHEFYTNVLLREMKTFMMTYKQGITRHLLTKFTKDVTGAPR